MHLLYHSTSFCIPAEKKLLGLLSKPGVHRFLHFLIGSESATAQRLLQRTGDVIIAWHQIQALRRKSKKFEAQLSLLSLLLYEDVHCHDAVRPFWTAFLFFSCKLQV